MRWKLPTAILLLLLAAGAWMLTRHLSSPAASIESNRTVTSTPTAVPGTVSSATGLDASGYVVARRTATVSAQTIGMVTEVLFEEGEHVEAGQILARLDGRAATASRDIAVSQLAAARKLAQQYEVQFDQAHREGQRATELATRKLVARQDAEQAIAKAAGLRAQLAAQRSTAEATRAQVEAAHVLLEQTVIRAPFAGVITSKAAQVGEIISPSAAGGFTRTGIATIVDMHSLEIEVDVGEAYISRIVPGMPARIRLNAYPELDLAGKVIAIIPTADRGKATVRARIGLDTSDPRILPDMAARVSFLGTAVPSMPGAVPTPLS
ncbi:efflux RND transporter periplasmic adaptor subunit [Stenotrophomonas sp.]|uniref:efflux RND transporter periplasmic adaptor subunit n=1 Tax=Stenotrophomonas sp. TaxID=69392 RepID=UPI002FC9D614